MSSPLDIIKKQKDCFEYHWNCEDYDCEYYKLCSKLTEVSQQ